MLAAPHLVNEQTLLIWEVFVTALAVLVVGFKNLVSYHFDWGVKDETAAREGAGDLAVSGRSHYAR